MAKNKRTFNQAVFTYFPVEGPRLTRQPPEGADVLWRAEVKVHVQVDEWGEVTGRRQYIELAWHAVSRRTPKGAWVSDLGCYPLPSGDTATFRVRGDMRFVRLDVAKRWAAPSEALALQDLWHRARKRASIYEARAKSSRSVMDGIEHMLSRAPGALPGGETAKAEVGE